MAATEMLAVAQQLLAVESQQLDDAIARRAVSTAYYALFHLLTEAAAELYISAGSPAVAVVRRTFNHEPMKAVSGIFSKGQGHVPKLFLEIANHILVSDELKTVAKAFVDLQVERERADYDFSRSWSRIEASQLVTRAVEAFAAWEVTKGTDAARLYLASFLLHKTWNQDPRG